MSPHSPVVIDIAGTTLSAADRRRLKHPLTGGVVLFARNFESRLQLTELTASIKRARPDVLICVDHEGGRVQRFRTDGFTALPAMRELGAMWMHDPRGQPGVGALQATDAASALGFVLASELRACGVDFSFAPVLDLDHGASSVIGARAFHRDPRVVSLLARAVAHGMLRAGMAHCGKHFPGHGYATADTHTAVAVDKRSLKTLLADDARPYEWLSSTLTAVMPAHVVYPKVDHRPAGYSERWLKDILRGQFGFTGAVFTDDLSMEAARRLDGSPLSYTEAVLLALDAGCDLALVCNQSLVDGGAAVDTVLAELAAAAEDGRWQPDPDSEARRLALLPPSAPLPWDELMHDPVYQHALERLP